MIAWTDVQRAAAHQVVIADIKQAMIDSGWGFWVFMVTEERIGSAVDAMIDADTVQLGMAAARQILTQNGYSDKISDPQLRSEVLKARNAAEHAKAARELKWTGGL